MTVSCQLESFNSSAWRLCADGVNDGVQMACRSGCFMLPHVPQGCGYERYERGTVSL